MKQLNEIYNNKNPIIPSHYFKVILVYSPVSCIFLLAFITNILQAQTVASAILPDSVNSIVATAVVDKEPNELKARTITINDAGNLTFTPGLRIQNRYDYDEVEGNNDFYIRRLRLKGSGNVFNIGRYYFEVKLDNEGKFNRIPRAQVENAWVDFSLMKNVNIRTGLYDMVFSRNALTSDSKLLLMDRSLIKNELTVIGITDNTVGILLHGRPLEGHLSYGFGIFDNLGFEVAGIDTTTLARESDGTMFTGRVGYDFFDPAKASGYGDYFGSYIGNGRRLTLSGNIAYLKEAKIGTDDFSLLAFGFDIFYNQGNITVEAEYDSFIEHFQASGESNLSGEGWYVQAGYLLFPKLEIALRYQELDQDNQLSDDHLTWTSIGMNYYLRGHNLKLQAEYIFKKEQGEAIDNDLIQMQLQLDF